MLLFNALVTLRLRLLSGDEEFAIGTYHMPCQFLRPDVMSIYAAMCAQAMENAHPEHLPLILAGDFNIKPSGPQYALLTGAPLPQFVDDPADPAVHGKATLPLEQCYPGDTFAFTVWRGPFKSAYATVKGSEPPFTTFACMNWGYGEGDKTFKGTLDYIFYRSGVGPRTLAIKPTKVRDLELDYADIELAQSLPTREQPSDHLMLGAEFAFGHHEAPSPWAE